MKIRGRILLVVILLMVLYISITSASAIMVWNIVGRSRGLYTVRLISVDRLIEADRESYQSNLAISQLLPKISTDSLSPEQIEEFVDLVISNKEQVKQRYDDFSQLMQTEPDDITAQVESFYPLYKTWSDLTDNIVALVNEQNIEQAIELFETEYPNAFQPMRDVMDKLTEYSMDIAAENYSNIRKAGRFLFTFYIVFSITGLLLSLLALYIVLLKIMKPIATVSREIDNLSSGTGDLTVRLPVMGKD